MEGDTDATSDVESGPDDCIVWVGQVYGVTSGGTVLGLGDSVTAGYGLGPSEGSGDNPSAYPLQLAQDLGVSGQDDAVEGACAADVKVFKLEKDGCDTVKSLQEQIEDVPDNEDPSIITLSVGADDIDFSDCIPDILFYDSKRGEYADPDVHLVPPTTRAAHRTSRPTLTCSTRTSPRTSTN